MKDYMDRRKETVFDNDLNTRTMIISKMWDMREKSMNSFQELDFLLSANGVSENKKIRKKLTDMSSLKNVVLCLYVYTQLCKLLCI